MDGLWHCFTNMILVGGFKHVLFSHNPSHWLSYFSRWLKLHTNQLYVFPDFGGKSSKPGRIVFVCPCDAKSTAAPQSLLLRQVLLRLPIIKLSWSCPVHVWFRLYRGWFCTSHGDHGNAMVKTRMGLASLRAKAGGVKGAGQQLQRTFFRKAKQLDSLTSVQVGQVQCHRKYYSIYVQHMDNSHELWHDFDQLTTLSIAVGHTRDFGRIIADNGILLLGGEVHCISSAPQWPAMAAVENTVWLARSSWLCNWNALVQFLRTVLASRLLLKTWYIWIDFGYVRCLSIYQNWPSNSKLSIKRDPWDNKDGIAVRSRDWAGIALLCVIAMFHHFEFGLYWSSLFLLLSSVLVQSQYPSY